MADKKRIPGEKNPAPDFSGPNSHPNAANASAGMGSGDFGAAGVVGWLFARKELKKKKAAMAAWEEKKRQKDSSQD